MLYKVALNSSSGHKAGISTIKRNDRFAENRNCVGKQLLLTFYRVYHFYDGAKSIIEVFPKVSAEAIR
jgi:hypothetical protein